MGSEQPTGSKQVTAGLGALTSGDSDATRGRNIAAVKTESTADSYHSGSEGSPNSSACTDSYICKILKSTQYKNTEEL